MKMFEILVPCQYNSGKPIRTRHHKEWDKVVRKIAGGLTLLKPVEGQWVSNNILYEDRVIPVRIVCTDKQIKRIMKFTISHYKQLAVMAYEISNNVLYMTSTDD